MFIPKKTKLLIVDRSMTVMRENKRVLAELPFATRYQSIISEEGMVIDKYSPHVIAYTFGGQLGESSQIKERARNPKELKIQEEANKEKSESAFIELKVIFDSIKALGNEYNPYVIIFNSSIETTDSLRDKFGYQNILVYSIPMNLKMVIDMGHMVEKKEDADSRKKRKGNVAKKKSKEPGKGGQKTTSSFDEDRNYLSLDKSYGSISHNITFTSMTESEVTFSTGEELRLGVFKVKEPIPMYITTIPTEGHAYKKDGAKFLYQGLIHGWDEEEKKAIRSQVSKIFMRDKAEQEAAEKAEFDAKQAEAEAEKSETDDDKKAS